MNIKSRLRNLKSLLRKVYVRSLAKGPTLKLIVGASKIEYKGWVLTEMDFLNLLKEEDWKYLFKTHCIDAILAEHVWEHLTAEEGFLGATNCYKYLKHGGYLRIAVPDGNHPDKNYIDYVKPGGSGEGSDDHKVLYTIATMKQMLEEVGFEVRALEWFDENGQFHFKEWNPEDGMVSRSSRFDDRNKNGELNYTSLIVDAIKT
jgi:predicted SAM-dependent methyltransferase